MPGDWVVLLRIKLPGGQTPGGRTPGGRTPGGRTIERPINVRGIQSN
jgi:hypothetical protein